MQLPSYILLHAYCYDYCFLGEEGHFFEGDIRLLDVSKVEKRGIIMMQESGVTGLNEASPSDVSGNLWPDGIVYYTYDENIRKLDVYKVKLITKFLCLFI